MRLVCRNKNIIKMYQPMKEYVIFGKPALFNGAWNIVHPEVDAYNPERPPTGLVGVYPLSDKGRKKVHRSACCAL